ncbi:sensor domain-containing diguanylate cyclase [Alkalimonas collagenimarina]|uniref:diguanylate cyclase n=1 Tax=Alkalimonas collagenimarina TaxID=400390 RepID=A0ABT9GYG9_9GAMM|nr:sensor domain-containing diguanylate cyclase [Alkalimonas collagenimarina]MDP4536106.1 sensor domain-containing diguanylate cyclase [Alkalimonas collagenimarina]
MHKVLVDFLYSSGDGYGIFNTDDQLVYANPALGDIFSIPIEQLVGMGFDAIIRYCHQQHKGLKIETDDLENWLLYAAQRRRSVPFRIFEADTMDGRWFLMSEQCNAEGAILLHAKEITVQKQLQQALQVAEQQLRHLANTDELTKIANRRSFTEQAERVLLHQDRTDATCSMLMLDIDHFKQLNDEHGHLAGDLALQFLTRQIKQHLREYDLFARYGGEEFVVLLTDIPAEEALQVAERIHRQLAENPFQFKAHKMAIEVSIGVAEHKQSESLAVLLQRSDQALYQAKAQGRNCSVVAKPIVV